MKPTSKIALRRAIASGRHLTTKNRILNLLESTEGVYSRLEITQALGIPEQGRITAPVLALLSAKLVVIDSLVVNSTGLPAEGLRSANVPKKKKPQQELQF